MNNVTQAVVDIRNCLKDINNPIRNFLSYNEITDEIQGFNGEFFPIAYKNGRSNLEAVGREIVMRTFNADTIKQHRAEVITEDKNRSDLELWFNNKKVGLTEIKQCSKDTKKVNFLEKVEQAFIQTKKYIENVNDDIFVSVVLMDVLFLVNNIGNICFANNTIFSTQKKSEDKYGYENFKKYGFAIVTKKFINKDQDFSIKNWNAFPKIVDFYLKTINTLGVKQLTCSIERAISIPSASSMSHGIKNVRDIKTPEASLEKKRVLFNILETSIEAFNNGADKSVTRSLITAAGKDKDFSYCEDDSILYQDQENHIIIATINGALIDGQNSIDCFAIILSSLNGLINKKVSEDIKERINFIVDSKIQNQKQDFADFIKNTLLIFNVKPQKDEQEARNVAISKNNSMKVVTHELWSSEYQIAIQMICNELDQLLPINAHFPKKVTFGTNFFPKLEIQEIVLADLLANDVNAFNKTKDINESLLHLSSKGTVLEKDLKGFIKSYVKKSNDDSQVVHIKKIIDSYMTIRDTKKDCYDLLIKSSFNSNAEVEDALLKEIRTIEEDICIEKERLENKRTHVFTIKNTSILVKRLELYLLTKKIVNELFLESNHQFSLDEIKKAKSLFKKDKIIQIGYTVLLEKGLHKKNNQTDVVYKTIKKLICNICNIYTTYNIQMTNLRRSCFNAPYEISLKNTSNTRNSKEIIKELFDFS